MKNNVVGFYRLMSSSNLLKNSFWGVFSTVVQNLLLSVFFIILARQYDKGQFATFLIASTVYQLIALFSSMGLGQWFIREYFKEIDKPVFVNKFFKIQAGLGISFYVINVALIFLLYDESQIRILGVILGLNVIFDNLIYAITRLNIAESNQRRTSVIMAIDGLLKLLIGCALLITPISIIYLSILIILVRFITLNILIKVGTKNSGISVISCWRTRVERADIKKVILLNWRFVVIGCVYVVNWRLASILISKYLSLQSVADYEVAFKIFLLALTLPAIASATVYTHFIKHFNDGDFPALRAFFHSMFKLFAIFSMSCYIFVYSFADILIPLLFGENYVDAIICLKLMFLTLLISTTAALQANLIVAMKLEKKDMIFNIVNMIINITASVVGLYLFKSLFVVNYSILIAILIFQLLQDILLIKRGIVTLKNKLIFYSILFVFVVSYQYASDHYNVFIIFSLYALGLISVGIHELHRYKKNNANLLVVKENLNDPVGIF